MMMKGRGIIALGAVGLVLMAISRGRGPGPGARSALVTWKDKQGKDLDRRFVHEHLARHFAKVMRNAGATDVVVQLV